MTAVVSKLHGGYPLGPWSQECSSTAQLARRPISNHTNKRISVLFSAFGVSGNLAVVRSAQNRNTLQGCLLDSLTHLAWGCNCATSRQGCLIFWNSLDMQCDVLTGWKHALLKEYCAQRANPQWEHGKSLLLFLFSSGKGHQHRLEFGLHAEYVQHDPVWAQRNPPHDRPCLCRPHLSIFSANHYNRSRSFHPPHSHLLLSVRVTKGKPCRCKPRRLL